MRLYNTLSRKIERFVPLNADHVGVYSCGPTVYDFQHIGHMRRYVGDDILVRVLGMNEFKVKHVMNITDVGHLTSDGDTGEDKMEKGATKFGLSVWDLAKKFEKQFFDSTKLLNVFRPSQVLRATEHIADQIALIGTLEEKGYTYKITGDGIYFNTSKFKNYFKLSRQNPQKLKAGARVEVVEGKKNSWDFALWKFSPKGEKRPGFAEATSRQRQMEWESPWGVGFPGWHIECSAMSMKSLGFTFDIHTGGIDHIHIHHTNEIAQSEAATGRPFVHYWVHHNFLLVEGQKMSKSIGNIFTVQDIVEKGYNPLSLRYLYLQTHYRQEMNFTWEALDAAEHALLRLYTTFSSWEEPGDIGCQEYEKRFMDSINDDLNTSQALAVMWELIKSDYPTSAKALSILTFDEILGLGIKEHYKSRIVSQEQKIPQNIMELVAQRDQLRSQKRFHLADQVRSKIKKMGYEIQDTDSGETKVKKISR